MAALALVGAVVTSCSSDDELLQPTNPGKVITLSTTVNLDNGSGTRALNPTTGAKTFAVGETMALRYMSASGWKKAVSHALTISDITGGTSATFTFDLEDPVKTEPVSYVYPASMADEDGDIDLTLLSTQNGTSGTLASNFDLAYKEGAWVGENLPSVTLENQLAILAIKLKNSDGTSFITNTITEMNVSDGTNIYTVNRTAADGPIYVAIIPTENATITVTATDGTKYYLKTLSTKTYAANNVYPVNWLMPEYDINGKFSVSESKQVVFSPGNLQFDGTKWKFAEHQWQVLGANGSGNGGDATAYPMDLFTWGYLATPAYNGDTYVGGIDHLSGDTDWGHVMGEGWSTPTYDEWKYVFFERNATTVNETANARFAKGQVGGVHGLILFPDTYTHPDGVTLPVGINNDGDTGWNGNDYNVADWAKMEAAGCVFLPAAGSREGGSVYDVGSNGRYWHSTAKGSTGAGYFWFYSSYFYGWEGSSRYFGLSVRLVRP